MALPWAVYVVASSNCSNWVGAVRGCWFNCGRDGGGLEEGGVDPVGSCVVLRVEWVAVGYVVCVCAEVAGVKMECVDGSCVTFWVC